MKPSTWINIACFTATLVFALRIQQVQAETVLVEAESFDEWGGWVLDQQSIEQMGSAYLMAHGLGRIVDDATTEVPFTKSGRYRVWVRTWDWVSPWKTEEYAKNPVMKAEGFPGRFQVLIDGRPLDVPFGTQGETWHWHDGGTVNIPAGTRTVALRDLTGFNGRCDAIVFTLDHQFTPPASLDELTAFRRKMLQTEHVVDAGTYDLVVVGGGIAGICTAISAARHDVKVALIHNRPVLGGNNSSEVRVGLSGLIRQKPYTNLGNLVDEISPVGHWTLWDARKVPSLPRSKRTIGIIKQHPHRKEHNAAPAENYEDDRKLAAVQVEKNISLFLNTHADGVRMKGREIEAVTAIDLKTGQRQLFKAHLFADCTGDGNLGFFAGADFRQGRESKAETGEGLAPEKPDQLLMGSSMQWVARKVKRPAPFPKVLPWAVQFDDASYRKNTKGDWNWETGADRDQANETERIRDYALRVVFGNWRALKHHSNQGIAQKYAPYELQWMAYIAGKRESRRLLGDVILKQEDVTGARPFPDASVTTTWTIDLHYPLKAACACDAFMSKAEHIKIKPYPIPLRCLYSRNINNLVMAGRNISVTHVALGTVRVQRTTGMMGEVLGMAAALCKQHQTLPRGVYEQHLDELKTMMQAGVPAPANPDRAMFYR